MGRRALLPVAPAPRREGARRFPLLRLIEVGSLTAGAALILVFAGARLDSSIARRAQLAAFELGRTQATRAVPEATVDQSLWSPERIAKYRQSLGQAVSPPLAVLRIPRIGLEVPVLAGVDELTLNRGVGHIPSTSAPGEAGNVALAGHRDGFFRGLKDLAVGDRLELELPDGTLGYTVDSLEVVDPTEVRVLEPTPAPALTLVTCYPFYFVGKAPKRFIVRAYGPPNVEVNAAAATENR